ncbi:MAG: CBS domain-containing protein [Methylobacter sp.]|nr:MAG: CBS domain-containing protein [Methylobacter sp.]
MLTKITVADYMSKRLVTLAKDTDVVDAVNKLLDHKITSAPVVDQLGHLLGMFSEKDVMSIVLEAAYNQSMSGKVGDYMTTEIMSVDADSSIVDLAEKFQQSSIRSYPVFQDNELVGIVSRTDVLRALASNN